MNIASQSSWVDGAPADSVPLDDRGLQYGDGLFETLRVRRGRVRFLDAHLARLSLGCSRLAIPMPEEALLRAELQRAADVAPELAVLKLVVTRGSGPRGYSPRGANAARRIMSLFATGAPAVTGAGAGVDLRFAQHTASENSVLAGIKHLNRLENVLVAQESGHEGVFDSLMLDAAGLLIGGTMTNIFLVREGWVITPRVDRAGVAGVMRGIVLRECAVLGLPAAVCAVPAGEIASADEVFVTNARVGVVSVRRVGEHVCPMNSLAARLAAHIETLDA